MKILHFIWQYTIAQVNIDTLLLLFCLMGVVEGFQYLGYIDAFAQYLVQKTNTFRGLALCLTGIAFFFSMLVTNDVALIITVPFTIQLLNKLHRNDCLILLVVFETIAANLGSMMTPIGNPQNVYLYQKYHLELSSFLYTILPYGFLAFVLLILCVEICFNCKQQIIFDENAFCPAQNKKFIPKKKIWTAVFVLLFILCLCNVFRILPGWSTFLCVTLCLLLCEKRLLQKINYGLLGKFIILFILIGDIASIPMISIALSTVLTGHEFYIGVLISQIVSNVPAAILLSEFTQNGVQLLLGVNIGGLGTLIASMASMISLDYYGKSLSANRRKYILTFTGFNLLFLALMLVLNLLLRLF